MRKTNDYEEPKTGLMDNWIISGQRSSGKKDVPTKISKNRHTWDKTVQGAKDFVSNKTSSMSAKNILLQIGSNDLEDKEEKSVVKEMEDLIATVQVKFPRAKILVGEILPRNYHNREKHMNMKINVMSIINNSRNCVILPVWSLSIMADSTTET